MPLDSYRGTTFVAFADISGFKEMMKHRERAALALDQFYSVGYDVLESQKNRPEPRVEGLFVSDAGVLFVRHAHSPWTETLQLLLEVIRDLNVRLLRDSIMLTTSIAYGEFSYKDKFEFPGIRKDALYGNAYLDAFLDNTANNPRIQPGQCRILSASELGGLKDFRLTGHGLRARKLRPVGKRHFYYDWPVSHGGNIDDFLADYCDTYTLKYTGMLEVLRKWALGHRTRGRRRGIPGIH